MSLFNGFPSEYLDVYHSYFDLDGLRKKFRQKGGGFRMLYAREHPVSFAWFCLGKRLRPYQAFAIDKILAHPKTALCWARRLGKSTVFGVLAFWMCYFNKFPKNQVENFTVIGVVSKENDAAKKILSAIKGLIYDGDSQWFKISKGGKFECKDYFSSKLREPTNAEQITFSNRSVIKSFPPTKKVKGWGFSFLFIDEIAYLDPKEEDPAQFYSLTCLPTLADCGGKISIASTPAGKQGLFYELFDPYEEFGTDFVRLWFPYTINNDEHTYINMVESEKDNLRKRGREAFFKQEYEADFTVIQDNFFDYDDVQAYFDAGLAECWEWKKTPCSVGVDFGISDCLTVVTVKCKYRNKIRVLYQRVFPQGFDNNELMNPNMQDSIPALCKRYNVQWLVPEDSSVSDMFVKWCKREGFPVFPYRFSGGNLGSKNTAYHTYRSLLKQGLLTSPVNDRLKNELLSIQVKQEKINWMIGKPVGGSDDLVDSDVFATIPFFEDEGGGFGSMDSFESFEKCDRQVLIDISSMRERVDEGMSGYVFASDFLYNKNPFG